MFFDTMFFEKIREDVDLEFYEWILWGYKEPPIIARSYTSAIEEINEHFNQTGFDFNLYNILDFYICEKERLDIALIKEIAAEYGHKGLFREFGNKYHKLIRYGIQAYIKFLEDREEFLVKKLKKYIDEEIKTTLKSIEHCDTVSLQKEIGLPPFQDKQTKSNILKSLNERLKELKVIRRNYLNSLSPIGKKISKNSASTGLSNTKRDRLFCLLLIDLVEQIPDDMILLSDEADKGFLKLTEPVIRRKNQQPRRKHRGTVLNVSHCMFS